MSNTTVVFGLLCIGGIYGAYRLVSSLFKLTKYNVKLNQLQYFVLVSVAIGNIFQPFCGPLNIAVSSYLTGNIGTGVRCYLDGVVSYFIDMTTLYLMMVACAHSGILNKPNWTTLSNLLIVCLCWMMGLIWALPPLFGITNYIQKASNTFCCVDFASKGEVNQSFLYLMASIGFSIPIAITTASYFLNKRSTEVAIKSTPHGSSSERFITSSSLFRIALFRILMGQLYAICALGQVFGFEEYVTGHMEYDGLILLTSNFTLVPILLSNELNSIIKKVKKS